LSLLAAIVEGGRGVQIVKGKTEKKRVLVVEWTKGLPNRDVSTYLLD
jgi:hypothetical protein